MKIQTNDADKVPLQFQYFHFIATIFVLSFVLSNILASKIASINIFDFPAGMVTFPLSYIFSDILTEVYGFQRARQLLWFTVFCECLVVIFSYVAVKLPPATFWHNQYQYQSTLLPQAWLIFSSCIGYILGDYVNNKFLSLQKIKNGNKFIATRFIGSTALGVLVDNTVFTLLAYSPMFISSSDVQYDYIFWLVCSQYCIKVSYETIMTPFSVRLSLWLKEKEQVDIYDIHTNYSLFNLTIDESKHQNRYHSENVKQL